MEIPSEGDIRANAKLCFDSFGRLCMLFGEDSWFEDQQARCNLWAADLGVFAPVRVSADHRLRDYPVIRQVINQLLTGVAANLDHLAKLSSSDSISAPDDHGQKEEEQENQSDSSGSYTVPSLPSETNYDKIDGDVILQCRLRIKDAITRLYIISASIRQSGSRYRDQRAEEFVRADPERQSQSDAFFEVSKAILTFKYQKADEQLRIRTAKTIVLRQNRIAYRRSHREKRAEVIPDLPEEVSIIRDTARSETSATKTNLHPLEHGIKSAADNDATQSSAGSDTWSSTFGSTDSQNIRPLELPRPPDVSPGDYFSCNYCCRLCPADEASERRWRKHIIKDLMPYYCVWEDCPTPTELFDSFNDWLLHMRQAHQRSRWVCFSPAHEPRTFNAESWYISHMESTHPGTFSREELPNLTRMAMSSKSQAFTKCPFCLRPAKGSDSPEASLITNEEEYRLQKHLAAHLISLALLSLRWVDDSEKAGLARSSSVAHSKRSTISGLDSEYSLSFKDQPTRSPSPELVVPPQDDLLAVAYQAGKSDAEAERFGNEQDPSLGLVEEGGRIFDAVDAQSSEIDQENNSFGLSTGTQHFPSKVDFGDVDQSLTQTQEYTSPVPGSYAAASSMPASHGPASFSPEVAHHIITGTSGAREEFDPHYRVHRSLEFKFGRIFKVLLTEPKGPQPGGLGSAGGSASTYSLTFRKAGDGKTIFAKVRRFVIVKPFSGHCLGLPISTYSGQGVNKQGAHAEHHAIIYSGKKPVAFRGEKEKGLRMRPIRIIPDNPRHKLDDASRLNYAKIYTLEYNMKVQFVGKVHTDSEWQIRTDYNRVNPQLELKDPYNGYSGGYYGSSNIGQVEESQDALNERQGRLNVDLVSEEGESHEAEHDDIYAA